MTDGTAARPEPVRTPRFGLSGKLLVLTILFVMIAEVLIYVPSVANFRVVWLKDRLATAYTAALVLDAAPNGVVSDALAKKILNSIGARAVAMKMGNSRRMLAVDDMPPAVAATYDMRTVYVFDAIVDAFTTMLDTKDDVIRVVGPAPMGGEYIDLVMNEQPLRKAMLRYSADILFLSLVISGITAALVYLALLYLFVRPMRRVTANMIAFRGDPENGDRVIAPSARNDEIGTAERELATMQIELASMLHQKNRLASLGLAVAKINHDLRNLLASAQLFSDRLAKLPDPGVQRFAPKLMHALERAIAFCQSTLSYGRLQEPPPERRPILLEPLVEEVHETLGLGPDAPIRWIGAVERGLVVEADYDQLFRILLNLSRNAVGAMENREKESRENRDPGRDQIRITGRREGAVVVIEVSDTGPGFSDKARAHLFEAFQGSTRTGGTGLGLAIAAELVRAHGGDIRLVEGTIGATLRLTIPDRAVELAAHRGARASG
ncbi:MAG TPA: HAMP domain-containing sensor histidine kinase [Xanthobacteraceae bacterium]|jgi:signal transduction histidine kinase|nr:HAMP domain-containing sensor histidine kinase [Xanthobacteraceae bacterium]